MYYNHDSVTRFKKRKARFSFSEVHILLDEVRKHRMVVVGMCLSAFSRHTDSIKFSYFNLRYVFGLLGTELTIAQ